MGERIHLGDGAYVEHDGYYLWLTADPWHRVALEPSALVALVRHAVKVMPTLAEALACATRAAS